MKRILTLLFVSIVILNCSDDNIDWINENCSTLATVRDLTGLDGCGFVFELENGVRLEPVRTLYCGTPPLPKEVTEDPLFNFEFVDGKEVLIGYVQVDNLSGSC